jgi:crotonobetainyl-CoA:carnitine CoA-transferase CaiB-like acyl-CoA transferase
MKSLGSPLKLSTTPTNPRRRPPMLGEHTEEVREYGFSAGEISALRIGVRAYR